MTDDVYEPLARYRDEFKDRFAELTREKFRELTERSGVDVDANRALVAAIRRLEGEAAAAHTRQVLWGLLSALGFVGCAVCAALAWILRESDARAAAALAAGAAACVALGCAAIAPCRAQARRRRELLAEIERKKAEALAQMEPLNALYGWDDTVRLIEATVPRLQFDPFFTEVRLADLRRLYGWDDAFNEGKSMIFAQSGVINGNPFALGEYLEMSWGTETYRGSLDIEWRDLERDAKGNLRMVTRRETLRAAVEKPIPVYGERKVLVYGNDAAPSLTFSRDPSPLSGAGDGFFSGLRKRREIRRLEEYSRNLDDDSQYTIMGNRDFEALFHAKDRSDEVEFRLLFTPLAQTQMLALLNDRKVGYGDDFRFVKDRRINFVFPGHLADAPIDTDPARFRDWDYDRAAANFSAFNEKYFKDVFFAFAPLLTVPLYQQTRTHEDLWRGVVDGEPSSFWEHETIANYHGEARFRHPESVTRNILKTRVVSSGDGVRRVCVTAHGFRGVSRTDYVSVRGGDGLWHDVPVEWTEYQGVSRSREMSVSERREPAADFAAAFRDSPVACFRRSVYSFIPQARKES